MLPVKERKSNPAQLSEETHYLCISCNKLVCVIFFEGAQRPYHTVQYIAEILARCAQYAIAIDRQLEQILIDNVEKLKARYPDGFTAERSINRSE